MRVMTLKRMVDHMGYLNRSFPGVQKGEPRGGEEGKRCRRGEGLKGSAVSCGFLRKSAVFCENLRFSAVSCALQMLEFPGEGVNLRKSAVFCENLRFGRSLSP